MKRHCEHLCPRFQAAMDVLGKPWTGMILTVLAAGAMRFRDLTERLDVIGDRMLSERLKELEAKGLVTRRVLPGPPVGVEYELTPAGRGFGDVADALERWGQAVMGAEAPAAKKAPRRKPA